MSLSHPLLLDLGLLLAVGLTVGSRRADAATVRRAR